jgi:hypothetical protein
MDIGKFANERVIGLDVRPRSFGFIVIEGAGVLDCGSRSCGRSDSGNCLGLRFRRILQTYRPSVVIIRSHGAKRTAVTERRRAVTDALRAASKEFGTPIIEVSPAAVREYFHHHDAHTKYEIAHTVASFFPELAWKLPPQRKVWQPEHYRMSIFDAAAVALTQIGPRPNPPISIA